jgi:hypothetical protein
MNYSYQHGNSGLEDQKNRDKKQNQKIKKNIQIEIKIQKCKEKVRDPFCRGDKKNGDQKKMKQSARGRSRERQAFGETSGLG